jgi:hypothetical protein
VTKKPSSIVSSRAAGARLDEKETSKRKKNETERNGRIDGRWFVADTAGCGGVGCWTAIERLFGDSESVAHEQEADDGVLPFYDHQRNATVNQKQPFNAFM